MLETLFQLFAIRELGFSPFALGVVLAAFGPGVLLGSFLTRRIVDRFGIGRSSIILQLITGTVRLMVPAAVLFPQFALPWLVLSYFLLGATRTVINVAQINLILQTTPDHLQGRVNATVRFLIWGAAPIGALAGGYLASTSLGVTATMSVAVAGIFVSVTPMLGTFFRRL
jgi:predicted MFS family arabinose efflux permease